MNRLRKKYQQKIRPELSKELKLDNEFRLPKIEKVVLNMGVSDPDDPRERQKVLENIAEQFRAITGQQPMITRARKSVSNFGLRQGDPIGIMVTLRGERMWQFIDKLVSIVLPRVKDFRGISLDAFDGHGNYSLGLEEQIVFPEIDYDEIENVRGLQVNIVTSTDKDQESRLLLEKLGFPFQKQD